jgi:predicted enzyme related to lactoylglutathione lyase
MGRVVHFEIHAENPERAVKFYSAVFGWQIKKWDGPMEYWMVMTGDPQTRGIDGGLLRRRGPAPADGQAVNAFICTVDVANVDASAKAATDNGGTLALPKMAVPGVGWLVYVKDTEGNILGLMQMDTNAK